MNSGIVSHAEREELVIGLVLRAGLYHHGARQRDERTGMTTDEEIMAALCAGDRKAYTLLVNRYLRLISHYCYRMTGNRSEAEDLSQETFLRLWTRADSWRPELASLSTWLHRIAHNLCIDHLRRDKSALMSDTLDTLVSEDGCEQSLDQEARLLRLRKALSELPERQRSALVLFQFQGLSNREVAEVMNLSVEALESLLARARRTLKRQLLHQDAVKEHA